ncbi:MAG: dehydrogenase [Nitrosopumilales archaeon]|jgi:geranylgeranyl reductase family protein|uniref:NAD(P)/FAD-dependent oxidoreductase n=1 Tax=Marine Group I thaumarchaeote TaxID=2511932 RepID=A0A7K4NKV1_9ARCH|nr:NAD(P)/FAD-dependent oxidoreductase [Marine Group I thaumarchaeote]PBO82050.1 MAG: dehydrogenase [Nitrosopumilales archaeon]
MEEYDVVIAGGSISGLISAREIAKKGYSVLVLEEGFEVGTPDHCGGLVSKSALHDLGIEPTQKTFDSMINSALIFSPNGKQFEIDSKKQEVVVVNRRELDKQVALQAQQSGAEIRVKTSFKEKTKRGVRTSIDEIGCKILVDCRGVGALINNQRDGILLSAQYEVYADWITEGKVEVYFDQIKYPGFFAWIIPSGKGVGKVGIAGREINVSKIMEQFLRNKGKYSTVRKIFAPIWIKGPIKDFISGDVVIAGDAAGQSKPTTAGGIYSCAMGGLLAGNAITKYLETNEHSQLQQYQKFWHDKFGKEFEKQRLARKILERVDNKTIDMIFDTITPEIISEISNKDDFDFHATSIVKLLGMRKSLSAVQNIMSAEIKRLLTSYSHTKASKV